MLQQIVQFASSQARLAHRHVPHKLCDPLIRRPIALVIRLATDAYELASPAKDQRLDLPGRYFTIETPWSFFSTSTTASKSWAY